MADKVDVAALAKLARLTPKEIAGVRRAQKEVRAGKYASQRKVKSLFARFRVIA